MSKRRIGREEPNTSKSTKRKRILVQNDDDSSSDEEIDKVFIFFLLFLDFQSILSFILHKKFVWFDSFVFFFQNITSIF